jgi:hypothetical protein
MSCINFLKLKALHVVWLLFYLCGGVILGDFHHKLLISTQIFQRKKEISFYHTLNILSVDVTKKCLVGQGWSPVFATSQVIKFSLSLVPDYVPATLIPWFCFVGHMIYNISFAGLGCASTCYS